MIYRTEAGWIIAGYLYMMAISGQHNLTLRKISNETGIDYSTVWSVINRLESEYCLKVFRYRDIKSEIGFSHPHALVSIKGYARELCLIFWWLDERFAFKKAA